MFIQASEIFTFPDADILFVEGFQVRLHSSLESLWVQNHTADGLRRQAFYSLW